jgi:hypothetical protein
MNYGRDTTGNSLIKGEITTTLSFLVTFKKELKRVTAKMGKRDCRGLQISVDEAKDNTSNLKAAGWLLLLCCRCQYQT